MPEVSAQEAADRWAVLDLMLVQHLRRNNKILQQIPEGNDRLVLLQNDLSLHTTEEMIKAMAPAIEQDPVAAWDSFFALVNENRLALPPGPGCSGWEMVWTYMREITAPAPMERKPMSPQSIALLQRLWDKA